MIFSKIKHSGFNLEKLTSTFGLLFAGDFGGDNFNRYDDLSFSELIRFQQLSFIPFWLQFGFIPTITELM